MALSSLSNTGIKNSPHLLRYLKRQKFDRKLFREMGRLFFVFKVDFSNERVTVSVNGFEHYGPGVDGSGKIEDGAGEKVVESGEREELTA